MFGSLDDFVELDDAGMSYEFEDMYFSGDSFDIGHVNDFLFLQDFYGDFLASWDVRCRFNFAESSFSECLAYLTAGIPMT